MKFLLSSLFISTIFNPVFAQSNATGNFQTQAQINATCEFSTTDINLGVIKGQPNPISTIAASPVSLRCSKGITATIFMNDGTSLDSEMKGSIASNKDTLSFMYFFWNSCGTNQFVCTYLGNGLVKKVPIQFKFQDYTFATPDTYSTTMSITANF